MNEPELRVWQRRGTSRDVLIKPARVLQHDLVARADQQLTSDDHPASSAGPDLGHPHIHTSETIGTQTPSLC